MGSPILIKQHNTVKNTDTQLICALHFHCLNNIFYGKFKKYIEIKLEIITENMKPKWLLPALTTDKKLIVECNFACLLSIEIQEIYLMSY